jgi:hypothetical protein
MPRRAPDGEGVTEHRMTLGNFERQFIQEVKSDVETSVKFAGASVVALPVGVAIGGAFLGYGFYRGAQFIGAGLSDFDILPDLGEGSMLGWLTFGLYDDLAKAAKEEQRKKREEEGLPPKEETSSAQDLANFLLFTFTGKGLIWGRD